MSDLVLECLLMFALGVAAGAVPAIPAAMELFADWRRRRRTVSPQLFGNEMINGRRGERHAHDLG